MKVLNVTIHCGVQGCNYDKGYTKSGYVCYYGANSIFSLQESRRKPLVFPYAFNVATGKYDIQKDTDKYQAIVDVRSLTQLIAIVQNAISKMLR